MNERIRQIAEAYAANAGEVAKLEQAIWDMVLDERQACAQYIRVNFPLLGNVARAVSQRD